MSESSYEESYRKRFPKGKDWKTPKKNPYGFCGLDESSYHGMETIAVSIEKYEEAQKEINRLQILWAKQSDEIRELKQKLEQQTQDFYFDMRNRQMEIEVLKNKLREAKGE